jgi:hypothetical protein
MAGFVQEELQTLIQEIAAKVFADAAPQLEALIASLASKLVSEALAAIESKLA